MKKLTAYCACICGCNQLALVGGLCRKCRAGNRQDHGAK